MVHDQVIVPQQFRYGFQRSRACPRTFIPYKMILNSLYTCILLPARIQRRALPFCGVLLGRDGPDEMPDVFQQLPALCEVNGRVRWSANHSPIL
jgi:hypothetical protein